MMTEISQKTKKYVQEEIKTKHIKSSPYKPKVKMELPLFLKGKQNEKTKSN